MPVLLRLMSWLPAAVKIVNYGSKSTLAAGEMYDLLKKRDTALEKYKAVIAENSATNSADLARHYMKQAYKTP